MSTVVDDSVWRGIHQAFEDKGEEYGLCPYCWGTGENDQPELWGPVCTRCRGTGSFRPLDRFGMGETD